MPITCAVRTCHNNANNKAIQLSFHRFPKDEDLKKKWIVLCGRNTSWSSKLARVCSVHFKDDDFQRDYRHELLGGIPKRKLKEGVAPNLNLPFTTTVDGDEVHEQEERKMLIDKIYQDIRKQEIFRKTEVEKMLEYDKENIQPEISQTKGEETNSYEDTYRNLLNNFSKLKQEHMLLKRKHQLCKRKFKSLENKIRYYKCKSLKVENKEKALRETLSQLLSENQINLLLNKKRRVNWTSEEIATAFTLRYYSKKSYIFLRETLKYPLPSLSSLRRWALNIDLRKGILYDILKCMKLQGEDMSDLHRCVVLQFDEVKIKHVVEYDQKNDEIIGPYNQMQVIMARGLCSKWKQPIYIDFDQKVTKEIILQIITKLHEINYEVVACVSDCGGGNLGLWSELEINIQKPYFKHPVTDANVYMFADAPHLLKLIRNWLLDTGFVLQNETIVTKHPLEALINLTDTEVNVCFKINEKHLTCEKSQRQNVRLAAELLSHTTATALLHYKPGDDQDLAANVSAFIDLVNKWFDIFNSYKPISPIPTKCACGIHLEDQNKILNEMKDTISNMVPIGKKSLQIFQKGILISIESLKMMYEELKKKFSISYLLTHRMNQDALEIFFFQIRSRGPDEHPSPLNAISRIRMIILGKNPGILHAQTSTEDRSQDEYIVAKVLKQADITLKISTVTDEGSDTTSSSSVASSDEPTTTTGDIGVETTNDALEYIAGYIAKKFKKKYPHLGAHTYESETEHNYVLPTWVQHLSYGGLIKPSTEWLQKIIKLNKTFEKFHDADLNCVYRKGPNVTKKLINKLKRKYEVPPDVLTLFIKLRTIIRINYINLKIKTRKKVYSNEEDRSRARKRKKIIN